MSKYTSGGSFKPRDRDARGDVLGSQKGARWKSGEPGEQRPTDFITETGCMFGELPARGFRLGDGYKQRTNPPEFGSRFFLAEPNNQRTRGSWAAQKAPNDERTDSRTQPQAPSSRSAPSKYKKQKKTDSTLHRAPVGQGPSGPDWLVTALVGFWSGRALATYWNGVGGFVFVNYPS